MFIHIYTHALRATSTFQFRLLIVLLGLLDPAPAGSSFYAYDLGRVAVRLRP